MAGSGDYWGGRKVKKIRDQLLRRDGDICSLCGRWMEPGTVSVDHIVPRSRGGVHDLPNLRLAHMRCNSRRGARSVTPADHAPVISYVPPGAQ